MAERLTDQPVLSASANGGDKIYIVDTSDTTDHPLGSSKQIVVANLLKGFVFGKNVFNPATPATTIWFNTSNSLNHPGLGQCLAHDFVVHMDVVADRMIIGVAITNLNTFPADLDDPLKFAKFYEGSKLL